MNFERKKRIKMHLREIEKLLDEDESDQSTKEDRVYQLFLKDKLCYTLKELSEKTSIPLKTLYGYADRGILKVTVPEAEEGKRATKIVLKENAITFLKTLDEN